MIDTTKYWLCNFDNLSQINYESDELKKLWSGNWQLTEYSEILKQIISDQIQESVKSYLHTNSGDKECREKILSIGIRSLLLFCEQNWTPCSETLEVEKLFESVWSSADEVASKLQCDSEDINPNTKFPHLLHLSLEIFTALNDLDSNLLHLWWLFRSKVIHQRVIEEVCPTLYRDIETVATKLHNESDSINHDPRLKTLLLVEIAQAFIYYRRVQKTEECLERAKDLVGLKLELRGVLGKRTRFQQEAVPQLVLESQLREDVARPAATETHASTTLPQPLDLHDDVRLNKMELAEPLPDVELPSLEQTILLATVSWMQRARPRDELLEEELRPHVEAALAQAGGAWAARVAALLARCQLDAAGRRTVQRALAQCEGLVQEPPDKQPHRTNRLSYLWASGLAPRWRWRQLLADLYLSLGLVKAALEEYLALALWEDVILCYTMLQLKHKAAEVIRQQIAVKPTAKLYCLLGDATDEEQWYETAWQFSGEKSSRAQRHWANHLFERKLYEQSIPHYTRSLDINSLQEQLWLRLGYAAMSCARWEEAARAYRRYTALEPGCFEAWNNLARVYVQQGDKPRAHRALLHALKCNYDNWKVWENVVAVSVDTGHFEDVVRGAHRLLELRGQFRDVPVLALLVRAVNEDLPDADGHPSSRLRKRALELMARVTSAHGSCPALWRLYAELTPASLALLRAQRLLRAYRGHAQEGKWSSSPDTCADVVQLALSIVEQSLAAWRQAAAGSCSAELSQSQQQPAADCESESSQQPAAAVSSSAELSQQLASARLTAQAVWRAADGAAVAWPQSQQQQQLRDSLDRLKRALDELTELMKSIN